ncbi:MAG: prepilin-type N-terminal cleavage/methylation domain-containing protein [Chitinispirillaceae bacterium]|nr:prepilin-type N-terminal cleavage/methylation domain-containing protein [Chitinispirillaceae bacterium]
MKIVGEWMVTVRRTMALQGFSLIEVLIVIAVILILSAVAVPAIKPLLEGVQLSTSAKGIKNQLICAKTRALGDSRVHCGVYFDTSATPDRVQVFLDNGTPANDGIYTQGSDQHFMAAYTLPPTLSLVIGGDGTNEAIIFRGDGSTRVHGMSITIRTAKNREKNISVLPSTGRIKITD